MAAALGEAPPDAFGGQGVSHGPAGRQQAQVRSWRAHAAHLRRLGHSAPLEGHPRERRTSAAAAGRSAMTLLQMLHRLVLAGSLSLVTLLAPVHSGTPRQCRAMAWAALCMMQAAQLSRRCAVR